MSLEECPRRVPGEIAQSRSGPMIVEYIESPVKGYLIYNFAVGESRLKSSAQTHPNWVPMLKALSDTSTRWSIVGLGDCHGDDAFNAALRKNRADAVLAALPPTASSQIASVSAAPLFDCVTDNTTSADRTYNRAALISLDRQEITFSPDRIEGTRPVPKPVEQPTVDCNEQQRREIAAAHPIAIAMVEKALAVFPQRARRPEVRALLAKYFNDPDGNWRIHAGFREILGGLRSDVKRECENKGSVFYDHFCPASSTRVRIAYVRTLVGFRVHLCEAAFGRSDLQMAETLVHEYSHMFDLTDDEVYCWTGRCSSLDRWDAYDNADSFSSFAAEAYLQL
jgi:hypothetical protein